MCGVVLLERSDDIRRKGALLEIYSHCRCPPGTPLVLQIAMQNDAMRGNPRKDYVL